jgi:trk system potassium uptake protein TrkH
MNKSFIRYILGTILKAEGVFLLLPVVIAAIYREGTEGVIYLGSAAVCFLAGFLISFKKPESYVFYLKEGCVATSLSCLRQFQASQRQALPYFQILRRCRTRR